MANINRALPNEENIMNMGLKMALITVTVLFVVVFMNV
nr:MAG TPA: hypothetical protein [Caudoviricetes sp.]